MGKKPRLSDCEISTVYPEQDGPRGSAQSGVPANIPIFRRCISGIWKSIAMGLLNSGGFARQDYKSSLHPTRLFVRWRV